MGAFLDNNLLHNGSNDQDQAIADGLLVAAKTYYKETRADLYRAVNLFVDQLITAAISKQDTYVFELLEELAGGFDSVPTDCFNGQLLDFVKELIRNGELDVSNHIYICLDESRRVDSEAIKEFELHDLWKEYDVYSILEEVLEEKLFGYLGKEQAQRLMGYPVHIA
jgi:hypothetical protein